MKGTVDNYAEVRRRVERGVELRRGKTDLVVHIDRLTVDGGTVIEPKTRRRRLIDTLIVAGAIVVAGCGLVAVVLGILG